MQRQESKLPSTITALDIQKALYNYQSRKSFIERFSPHIEKLKLFYSGLADEKAPLSTKEILTLINLINSVDVAKNKMIIDVLTPLIEKIKAISGSSFFKTELLLQSEKARTPA